MKEDERDRADIKHLLIIIKCNGPISAAGPTQSVIQSPLSETTNDRQMGHSVAMSSRLGDGLGVRR